MTRPRPEPPDSDYIAYHWTNLLVAGRILREGLRNRSYVARSPDNWIGEVCFEVRTTRSLAWSNPDRHEWQRRMMESVPPERARVVALHTVGDERYVAWLASECRIHMDGAPRRCTCGIDGASSTFSKGLLAEAEIDRRLALEHQRLRADVRRIAPGEKMVSRAKVLRVIGPAAPEPLVQPDGTIRNPLFEAPSKRR